MEEMLTVQQRDEAKTLVKYVLDKGGEAVLETHQKLLLARYAATLSAVPEGVTLDYDLLVEGFDDVEASSWSGGAEFWPTRRAAASRLASAAARVPGLEADLARAEHNKQVAERAATENVAERRTQLARAVAAESERDDARRQRDEALDDAERFRAQTDAARQEVATLQARVTELEREALTSKKDREALEFNLRNARQEAQAARELRAAREAEWKTLEARTDAERQAAESRATAAEAASGNALTYLRQLAMGGSRMDAEGEAALVSDLEEVLKGKPTPAPGLREAETLREAVTYLRTLDQHGHVSGDMARRALNHADALEGLAAYDGTAPDDALPKARVVEVLTGGDETTIKEEVHDVARKMESATGQMHVRGVHEDERVDSGAMGQRPDAVGETLPKSRVTDVLASAKSRWLRALDAHAAKPLAPAVFAGMATAIDDAARDLGLTLDAPTGSGGGETRPSGTLDERPECPGPDCLMCSGEACNKCGAGCWSNSHVADVEAGRKEPCDHDCMERHEEPTTRVHEDKAHTDGALLGAHPIRTKHREPVVLGTAPFTMVPEVAAQAVEATHRRVARIAPKHTPEGPALKRGFHDDRTCGACSGPLETSRDAVCETCAPESTAHATAESMAQPEPAAPEVVWEGDGVRVLEDGACLFSLWGEWRPTTNKTKRVLAGALAEARREREALVEAVLTAAAESAHAEVFKVYGDAVRAKQVAEAVMDVDLDALGLPLESP